ncbi:hypothetical protein lerEdw1_014572 [Lerista edwardsae]|nr:hypothetical protein lerEdw1_014572 [Lerista edwardsae]
MYRALYGFRSAEPSSLAFAAGETFLLLERSNQHWWLVTRAGSGETGYAPASYLQRLQSYGAILLRMDDICMLNFPHDGYFEGFIKVVVIGS